MILFRLLGIGIFASVLGVLYVFEQSDSAIIGMRLFHWPAILLTGLGPVGVILVSFHARSVWSAITFAFSTKGSIHHAEVLQDRRLIESLGTRIFSDGKADLTAEASKAGTEQLKRVLKRLNARVPVTDVLDMVQREFQHRESRLVRDKDVISMGVRMAPSVGMLGTILGMVQLLGSIDDPSKIGSHMSVALLTTFYGLFFSLAVWTPFLQRIQMALSNEQQSCDQIVHWLELLDQRKPIQYFSELETRHA